MLSAGRGEEYVWHGLLSAAAHRRRIHAVAGAADHDAGLQLGKKLEYALEGSVFVGGAVVQWLRDNMQFFRRVARCGGDRGSRCDSGWRGLCAGVYRAGRAALGPARERHDHRACSASTQIGHIARAALESIAFQVADVLRGDGERTRSSR